jgi:ribosome-binding ATPase
VDVPSVAKGGSQSLNLAELRNMDGLAVVVRGFGSDSIPHPEGSVDPARDLDLLETEFLLADHAIVSGRLERLAKEIPKKKAPELIFERDILERFRKALDEGTPLRGFSLTPEETRAVKGFGLLTLKPMLVILNAGEEEAGDLAGALDRAAFGKWSGQPRIVFSAMAASIEQEIARLSPEDQAEFLKDLGLPDGALDRLLNAAYALLGLISFLTAGEDECRAWSIPAGTTAAKAAGTIHSDFEQGFIRAEVVQWQTLVEHGTFAACRTHAALRLEGRDYVVQDGDVITFRFNV